MPVASASSDTLERTRSIPSLDGLRAIAVGAVILSHSNRLAWAAKPGPLRFVLLALGQGGLGVNAFFIISGFLITTLLISESERKGSICLSRFYFRRTLRIFPPYYVFLLVAAIVAWKAARPIPTIALAAAATYTTDYYPYPWIHPFLPSWYTLHTWSLSVEEQFYLIWPFALQRFTRRRAVYLCVGAVVLAPLLRWITAANLPVYAWAEQWSRLFHTAFDALAVGCLIAFALKHAVWRGRFENALRLPFAIAAGAYLVVFAGLFTHASTWLFAAIAISIANLSLAYLIVYVVLRSQSIFGRVLNWKPLRHIGLISYSLYLWQQIFLGPYAPFHWLGNYVAIFLCAELSFWIVERPSLKLRSILESRLFRRSSQLSAISTR